MSTNKLTCSHTLIQINREQWRDVVGFEGRYKVSSNGRILSPSRDEPYCRRTTFLKFAIMRRGYRSVRLYLASRQKRDIYVHRIVARAFLGESDLQVNHKNGIKADNAAINLEYVTQTENMRHRVDVLGIKYAFPYISPDRRPRGDRHGSKTKPENWHRGEQCRQSKLTGENVKKIRELYSAGQCSQRQLARTFNVHQSTIWKALHGIQWKHIY